MPCAPAGGADRPRHHVAPHGEIVQRIADHRGLAGRAGRSVDARELMSRYGQQTEWVVDSEVRLDGEGKALEVREGAEIVRMDAVLIEFGAHRRHGVVGATQRGRESARLQSDQLVARGRLDRIEQALVWRFAQPHEDDLTSAGMTQSSSTARDSADAGISPPWRGELAARGPISQARPSVVKKAARQADQAGAAPSLDTARATERESSEALR